MNLSFNNKKKSQGHDDVLGYKGHLNHSNVKQGKDLLHPLFLVSCARSTACDGIVV